MRDPDHYPKPLQFRGFRFVDEKVLESAGLLRFKSLQPSPSTLTDVGGSWHVWGTGRMAWCVQYLTFTCLVVLFLVYLVNNQ